MNTLLNIFTCV
jgi:hypothetical protein